MDLKLLETLKEKMVTAKALATIMEYFLDHFGEKQAFANVGRLIRHEIVESFLEKASIGWYQTKLLPASMRLVEIPEYRFIHGVCMFSGGTLNVLYFDDIQTGLIVSAGNRTRGSQLMRFSVELKPPGYASRN